MLIRSSFPAVAAALIGLAGAAQAQTCRVNGCAVPFGPDQYVLNNMWNAASDPAGTQRVTVHGPTSWSTAYNWPRVQPLAVRCYPASVLGWQFSDVRKGTGLPVLLSSNTPILTTAAFTVTGSAMEDIAYDCWFHAMPNPGSATKPTDEMMIWEAALNGPGPMGEKTASAVIDGHTWNLYEGWNTFGWEVHTFVIDNAPAGNLSGAALDLTDFTGYLIANRYRSKKPLLRNRYITGVEFGTEVVFGSGTFKVGKYTCSVVRHNRASSHRRASVVKR